MSAELAPAKKSQPILVRLWPLYIIVAGLGLAISQGWHTYLTPASLLENAVYLDQLVRNNLALVLGAYVLIYAASTAFMVPASVLTVAGGFLFGLVFGSMATVIGATLGASILFIAAKTSIGSVLREIAGPFLSKMEKEFEQNAFSYLFTLRLVPIFPFAVANIAPSLLGAKFRDYVFTTFFGIMPGTIAYTWIGAALKGTILEAAEAGENLDVGALIASSGANFLPAFAALGVVALIPVAYKKIANRKGSSAEEAA